MGRRLLGRISGALDPVHKPAGLNRKQRGAVLIGQIGVVLSGTGFKFAGPGAFRMVSRERGRFSFSSTSYSMTSSPQKYRLAFSATQLREKMKENSSPWAGISVINHVVRSVAARIHLSGYAWT